MRMILAALLTGGLFLTPAVAAPKKEPAKIVDYGDMRCAFAVRRHEMMDGKILAWANGFIQGYVRSGHTGEAAEHVVGLRGPEELDDAMVLREHIRGFCIKHRDRPVLAAVLAILHHPRATVTSTSMPHRPTSQPKAAVPPKPATPQKIPAPTKLPQQPQ